MLDAAVRIVAARGLEELTLAECGEAAGYSRGLAAHYFGSRDELIAAIATHIVRNYSERLRSGGRWPAGLPGLLEAVSFYIASGRAAAERLRAFHAVLGSALKQAPASAAIAQLNRDSIAGFAALIRSGVARGEIRRDVDPNAQASLILAGLRGVMTQWLLDPDAVDLDAVERELLRSLTAALRL